jgi:outer membrane lipoprotein-sorting protein
VSKKLLATTVCLAAMVLPSCLVRRRQTASPVKRDNRPLLTASKEELIQRIHAVTDPIQSFTIKTDMSPSVGNFLSGEVMDYATISGNILFRRPDEIRILGLDPLPHSTIFDMVSSDNDFRLYVPSKSQFIEGKNDAPGTSKSKLENLRPTAFLTSLLIYPPEPAELTLIEDDTDESKSVYILMVVRQEQGQLRLIRNVYFDRRTLQIARQKTFDASGGMTSETKYGNWTMYGAILFPADVEIRRPQDDYEVTLTILDVKANSPDLTPDKFVLEQPPGTQLEEMK